MKFLFSGLIFAVVVILVVSKASKPCPSLYRDRVVNTMYSSLEADVGPKGNCTGKMIKNIIKLIN